MPLPENHSGGRRESLVAAAATAVLAGLTAALILSGSGTQPGPESAAGAASGPPREPGPVNWAENAEDPRTGSGPADRVDAKTGLAAFHRLGELRPGDRVAVDHQDGTTATYVVDRVETFERDAPPTHEVYGGTDRSSCD